MFFSCQFRASLLEVHIKPKARTTAVIGFRNNHRWNSCENESKPAPVNTRRNCFAAYLFEAICESMCMCVYVFKWCVQFETGILPLALEQRSESTNAHIVTHPLSIRLANWMVRCTPFASSSTSTVGQFSQEAIYRASHMQTSFHMLIILLIDSKLIWSIEHLFGTKRMWKRCSKIFKCNFAYMHFQLEKI